MHRALRAAFMRGGTSKGLFFHSKDIAPPGPLRDAAILAAMGSPDPFGRQLDGMGGGISSLSKVMVIGPPTKEGADVDYTFGQVAVKSAHVDWRSNCGNLSSAVGPFAIEEGLVTPKVNNKQKQNEATVTLHNTNTGSLVRSRFPVEWVEGKWMPRREGEEVLAGVSGSAPPVYLSFLSPAGSITNALFPTGNVTDHVPVAGLGNVHVSIVDATTPIVFVSASALNLIGCELPEELEQKPEILEALEAIRLAGAEACKVIGSAAVPKIATVQGPRSSRSLEGREISQSEVDLTVRMMSMGRPHRALPLTGAMCAAAAACVKGTLVNKIATIEPPFKAGGSDGDLKKFTVRLGNPSGVLPVNVNMDEGGSIESIEIVRTQRRLMDGLVYCY